MLTLLNKLCTEAAPSGGEKPLANLIAEEIKPFADEVYEDALGNLIVHKKGEGKRLMLCAHMDEIGLVVTCIGEKGQLYVAPLGGVFACGALYQRVRFADGTEGVLVPDGDEDELSKDLKLNKLYVDIGAKDEDEAKTKVSVGDACVFVGAYFEQGDVIVSHALDDRVGCYALIEGLKQAQKNQNDLYLVFTVSEELGLRGAKAAAVSVAPDYAVALDVTDVGDVPSGAKMAVALGKGAAIKIMDHSVLCHPIIKNRLRALCEARGILWQAEVLEHGGTDAGAIHTTGGGVPTGGISLPTRYIHSPGEMIHKADLENTVKLVTALIEEGI